jgi:hypothetical protein
VAGIGKSGSSRNPIHVVARSSQEKLRLLDSLLHQISVSSSVPKLALSSPSRYAIRVELEAMAYRDGLKVL